MCLRTVGPRKWYASKYFSTLHRSFPYRSFSRAVLCDPFIHSTNTELQSIPAPGLQPAGPDMPVQAGCPVAVSSRILHQRHHLRYRSTSADHETVGAAKNNQASSAGEIKNQACASVAASRREEDIRDNIRSRRDLPERTRGEERHVESKNNKNPRQA